MGSNRRRAAGGGKGGGRQEEDLPLHNAARSGDMATVRSICISNPLAVSTRDRHSRTPLHLAAWAGQTEVVSYLCKNKADVGASAMDDMGAVHFASQKGHLEVVRGLLSSGASVKAANRKGLTPLHFAVRGSHLELVKYLVRKGASLGAKTKSGETPLDLANSDEVRTVIAECEQLLKEEQVTGNKNAVKQSSAHGKDVGSKDQDKAREMAAEAKDTNADVGDMARAVDEGKEHEREKRKSHGAAAEEDGSRSKKPRVALGHLLAEDDMEGEAE